MAPSISPSPFKAQWNQCNSHLKQTEPTSCQKVQKIAFDLFSIIFFPLGIARLIGWAVHFIAKKLILQSAWLYPNHFIHRAKRVFDHCCQDLKNDFEIQTPPMITPDNVTLSTTHFRHHQATNNTPTILFYQGSGSITEMGTYLWLIDEAVRRKIVCNFFIFNYRGVDQKREEENEDELETADPLLLDGDTAFQFVRDRLLVPTHLIHWYGWSLGASIATNIKAWYECEGPFVNERSFASLLLVASNFIPRAWKRFFSWAPFIAAQQGWNILAFLKALKGPTLVVYHPEDPVVHFDASAAHEAIEKKIPNVMLMKLYQTTEQLAKIKHTLFNHHFESLDNYFVGDGQTADQAIANFIFTPITVGDLSRMKVLAKYLDLPGHPPLQLSNARSVKEKPSLVAFI